jgi:rubrerythrin
MNPFNIKSKQIDENFKSFKELYPKPYNKKTVSPYTKTRVILMAGTEFEAVWFLHQFARNCNDNDLRREIALIRNQEQAQQKRIACLKPLDEHFLETTIAYEQLAIDLTAALAKMEKDANNKAALDFALLEDFDHLFRFANMLKTDFGIDADMMVGKFTEIMPGRPTIAEHRHPHDNVRYAMNAKTADPFSKLAAGIITGAEQQTMNFYMNMAANYETDLGRQLFAEIAMVEEEHVTQYESLKDPTCTWLENWLMHEYTECYLYYSMMEDETDKYIKEIWQEHFEMEVSHLKRVAELLKKYENKAVKDVFPVPEFPPLLQLGQNKEYIRAVLQTVPVTSKKENYVAVGSLEKDDLFFTHNAKVTGNAADVASHAVIQSTIKKSGKDYRYQESPHPIPDLDDRTHDNTDAGRV